MINLPIGWTHSSLGAIASFEMGQAPPGAASNFEGVGTPFVKAGEFGELRPIIREWTSSPLKFGRAQDVFICVVGATAGKLNLGVDCAIGRSVAAIRPETSDLQKFLYYQLLPRVLEMRAASSGSAQGVISQKDLSGLELVIAPAAEQTRIVAKLEELLSDLDAGVAELKAAQKKLAQYRQSLLKAAVEGSLTAEWRAKHAPAETGAQLLARILTERRARWEAKQLAKFEEQGKTPPKDWQKKYPEPVQPDVVDLPMLPDGWVWASVEQLGHVQLGRQRSPDKVGGANPTPYIRAANITEAGVDLTDVLEMDFSEDERKSFNLHVGDVLLTEASGSAEHVGRPAIWKHPAGTYCFQNTVLRFTPHGISSEFSFNSFLAMQKLGVFRKLSGGVGINHLSAGKFSKLPMPLPPLAEQMALVELIEQGFAAVANQDRVIAVSLQQSTAQRQNILRAAFSGQLVPQDPNDEPASVLLARIRAERAAQVPARKPRGRQKEAV